MSAQLAQTPAELTLTVLSGPDQGAVYKVVSTKVTIGRSQDNSIILKDPRCSRQHALLEITPEGLIVTDISTQNSIAVDGKPTKKAVLKSGSTISLGNTTLQLDIRVQGQQSRSLSVVEQGLATQSNASVSKPVFSDASVAPAAPFDSPFAAPTKKNKTVFYAAAAIIIGLIVWLLSSETSKRGKISDIRSDSQIEEDLKAAQERKDALIKAQKEKGIGTVEYNQAQAIYVQGFRDYREGNYTRAVMAFSDVLTLNPNHVLARKYRELAKRKLDEMIEFTMKDGRRLMEQGKYSQAMASFRQVMTLLQNDIQDKRFKEANSLFGECDLLMKGAY